MFAGNVCDKPLVAVVPPIFNKQAGPSTNKTALVALFAFALLALSTALLITGNVMGYNWMLIASTGLALIDLALWVAAAVMHACQGSSNSEPKGKTQPNEFGSPGNEKTGNQLTGKNEGAGNPFPNDEFND